MCSNAGKTGSATAPGTGREIAAQGYPASQRMVYRFLSTLKKTEVKLTAQTHPVVQYTSTAAVCLFMRCPDHLDEGERMDLAKRRQVHPDAAQA